MDIMLLVVDCAKGIQTQTSEGLVIGMLATRRLVVALNKVDQFPLGDRDPAVLKMTEKLTKVLSVTPFAGAPIIPVSAAPRSRDPAAAAAAAAMTEDAGGISRLKSALVSRIDQDITAARDRSSSEPFLMAVDHCFTIKGQGTVVTGTVLRGSIKVGDEVEVVELRTVHRVKSLQVFHKPVQSAKQGDRIGMALIGLDAKSSSTFERGIVAAPHSVPISRSVVGEVTRIPYFKDSCASKVKFHGSSLIAFFPPHHPINS